MNKRKTNLLMVVVRDLLLPNNTVTNLEVKNELRRKHPTEDWVQHDVSATMAELNTEGKLDYTSNGVYRTYSLAGFAANQPLAPATQVNNTIPAPKKKKDKVTSHVSKAEALRIIQTTNNHYFGVTFVKKDGNERKLVCRVRPDTTTDDLGYLDVVNSKDGSIKHVNMQTLSEVRTDGNIYKVR